MNTEIHEKLITLSNMNRGLHEPFKEQNANLEKDISILKGNFEQFSGTKAEIVAEEEKIAQKIKDMKKDLSDAQQKEKNELWAYVVQTVNKIHGVENHPKLGKAWEIADDKGHSSGYYEIVAVFEDIVELLK